MKPDSIFPFNNPVGPFAMMPISDDQAGQPYPLLRRFIGVAGPVFALFLVTLLFGSIFAMRGMVEDVYLQLAEQRASGVAAGVSQSHPGEWAHLIDRDNLASGDYRALTEAIAKEAGEFRLNRLKVYDIEGRTLFSMIPEEIGRIEEGAALKRVLRSLGPGLDRTTDPDGTDFYELYVPFFQDGRLAAVFELYEPIDYLDGLLLGAIGPAAVAPAGLLSLLVIVLFQLVRRAQRDIDWRTLRIADLTKRVERLVSRRAVQAMRGAGSGDHPEPRLVDCTLFFSDIRGFTVFSEHSAPAELIDTLNRIVALQVASLEEAGADVDKFIGDAVFARFEGPERAPASIRAALNIQRRVSEGDYPFSIGIGIASGTVVAGVIGAADRYDYTVLGDAVNVASRLCSAAGGGELVVDKDTADSASFVGGDPETLSVKGREAAVNVLRVSANAPDARNR